MTKIIDLTAPIDKYGGKVGVFKLKSHIKEYYEIIHEYLFGIITPFSPDFKKHAYLQSPFEMVYVIAECIQLTFSTFNGKLMKVTVLEGYKGYFKGIINIGMSVTELKNLEPALVYDEQAECYKYSGLKGLSIICDPYDRFIESISIYIEEWDEEEDFYKIEKIKKGEW
ncbi:hypothetical protein F4V43_05040 [Paenibacillus spiritus]|uniref:Uncharacterized protein n=1 Tax=Paenibacillus spiritus TaxID=2496557 RepID=A0A5J5GEC4_9BACL|nr:hypothetical protein [Paenibacillus spiritus]KAA9006330.1 hypothetical protein F4V43_05040 [Paenibacillus spiritus]